MGSIVQPYVPAVIASRIQEALACGLIGVILASCVYGITVLQAYIYYKNSHRDSAYMKSFVAFLFILDTASLALAIQTIYEYVVIDFGNPLLLINMPPAMALENGATVVIGTLTQCFLAFRLWEFSKKNITLVCTIVILSLCAFGSGMVVSVQLYVDSIHAILGQSESDDIGRALRELRGTTEIASPPLSRATGGPSSSRRKANVPTT